MWKWKMQKIYYFKIPSHHVVAVAAVVDVCCIQQGVVSFYYHLNFGSAWLLYILIIIKVFSCDKIFINLNNKFPHWEDDENYGPPVASYLRLKRNIPLSRFAQPERRHNLYQSAEIWSISESSPFAIQCNCNGMIYVLCSSRNKES